MGIHTYLIQLPPGVKGTVVPDGPGEYTIYLNSLYGEEQRREIFRHEMRHILLGHHDECRGGQALDADMAEREAEADGLEEEIRRAAKSGLAPAGTPVWEGCAPKAATECAEACEKAEGGGVCAADAGRKAAEKAGAALPPGPCGKDGPGGRGVPPGDNRGDFDEKAPLRDGAGSRAPAGERAAPRLEAIWAELQAIAGELEAIKSGDVAAGRQNAGC